MAAKYHIAVVMLKIEMIHTKSRRPPIAQPLRENEMTQNDDSIVIYFCNRTNKKQVCHINFGSTTVKTAKYYLLHYG